MKLLFDEMLSDRLPSMLADIYPGSTHVFDVSLGSEDDLLIWEYAKNYDYIVTSKDWDLAKLSGQLGSPPKLIHVRIGNARTATIEAALRRAYEPLLAFGRSDGRVFVLT